MYYTEAEITEFLNENDVKFVRLAFCDAYGVQKNISIMSSELHRAFTSGISFDASAISGFMDVDESDLFLVPDSETMTLMPWRPAHGRVVRFFCHICNPDGSPFELDSRRLLRQAVDRAGAAGIRLSFGAECEFYLFNIDQNGEPARIPCDNAGYMDIAPHDRGETVRREVCLTLEEMGIVPESSHHEEGPGQNEIDFKYSDALTSADRVMTFKSIVEMAAARNGMWASFRPKPLRDRSGNGFHINVSPRRLGDEAPDHQIKAQFMAGILAHIKEITAFLNPTEESYERLGAFKAPRYITWSHKNRSQLIRIPAGTGEYDRIELRSADCMCNPYLAYTLIIEAGLDGVRRHLVPPEAMNRNLYAASADFLSQIETLPATFAEAISLMSESSLVRSALPEKAIEVYKKGPRP